MFRSGINDEDVVRFVICGNEGWAPGEEFTCTFEDEVEGIASGYSFFWTCPECDMEHEEDLIDTWN